MSGKSTPLPPFTEESPYAHDVLYAWRTTLKSEISDKECKYSKNLIAQAFEKGTNSVAFGQQRQADPDNDWEPTIKSPPSIKNRNIFKIIIKSQFYQ